jgi:hypothetical protein
MPAAPTIPTPTAPSAICGMCHRPFDPSEHGAFTEVVDGRHGTAVQCCTVPCLQRWLSHYQAQRPLVVSQRPD